MIFDRGRKKAACKKMQTAFITYYFVNFKSLNQQIRLHPQTAEPEWIYEA